MQAWECTTHDTRGTTPQRRLRRRAKFLYHIFGTFVRSSSHDCDVKRTRPKSERRTTKLPIYSSGLLSQFRLGILGRTLKGLRIFVPTSLFVQKSGILCPRLFVPTSLYAPKSGILCPRLFVPTSLYAQKSGILCSRLFVPTSLCAHVSICPNVCQWEFRVGILYVNSQTYQWPSNGQTDQWSRDGQADQWSVVKLTNGQAVVKLTRGKAVGKLTSG